MSGLPLEPVGDVEAAASRCAGRALQVEGIPMVLALEDVTGTQQPVQPEQPERPVGPAGPGADGLGAALAARLADYHRVLFPSATDDAYWAVHDALVVVSDAHGPGRS